MEGKNRMSRQAMPGRHVFWLSVAAEEKNNNFGKPFDIKAFDVRIYYAGTGCFFPSRERWNPELSKTIWNTGRKQRKRWRVKEVGV